METDYASDLPLITAVSDQIKQVFLNLLTNAADACQNRGGVVTVSTRSDNDRVAIAIKDTGVGIRPEDRDDIFRPFYTTKPEVKGIGLGLSICSGIVKKHKGEIRIDSTPGEASTFTIVLPINSDQVEGFTPPDPCCTPGPAKAAIPSRFGRSLGDVRPGQSRRGLNI